MWTPTARALYTRSAVRQRGCLITDPEPELIESSLNWSIVQGGRRLKVNIVRLTTEGGWSLEVVNDRNTSIVWDGQFETDRNADAAFLHALAEEGFEAFFDKD